MTLRNVGLTATVLMATLAAAQAATPPKINKVTIAKTGTTYSATVTGTQFGTAPAGIPCNACSIPEIGFVATSQVTTPLTYNVTSWTTTEIKFTGIQTAAGNALFLAVKNDALGNVATWGGNIPGKKNPKITKVAFAGQGANLQITITGTGFGPAPSGVPGTTDIPYLNFLDWNIKAPGQFNFPWGAGWAAQNLTDTATLKYTSWTDTQIVISGFAGSYGTNGFTVSKGDPFVVWLWQNPGINPGSTGPQTAKGGRING